MHPWLKQFSIQQLKYLFGGYHIRSERCRLLTIPHNIIIRTVFGRLEFTCIMV